MTDRLKSRLMMEMRIKIGSKEEATVIRAIYLQERSCVLCALARV